MSQSPMDERLSQLLQKGVERRWRKTVEAAIGEVVLSVTEAEALAAVLDVFFHDYPVDPVTTPELTRLQRKLRGEHD